MSLGAHLIELRKRLFLAALALIVASIAGWFLSQFVLDFLREPVTRIAEARSREATLNYPGVSSSFDLRIQISVTVGVIISSPVWLYQIWAFIVPALASAVDLVIHCVRDAAGERRVQEVIAPTGEVIDGRIISRVIYSARGDGRESAGGGRADLRRRLARLA